MATLEQALAYTRQDGKRLPWQIIPVTPRGKAPWLDDWTHNATTSPYTVTQWWKQRPGSNIGLVTGFANNVIVLDIDQTSAVDGSASLAELEQSLGRLPDTVTAITPSGGTHYYFKYPQPLDLLNAVGVSEGIDIRANGGQVLLPPSQAPNKNTGKLCRYEWESTGNPAETDLAELPEAWRQWLFAVCGNPNTVPLETVTSWNRFALPDAATVQPGFRDDTLFRYGCSLDAHGKTPEQILAALLAYNRAMPVPLPEKQVTAKVKSVLRYHDSHKRTETPKTRPAVLRSVVADAMQEIGFSCKYNVITGEYDVDGTLPSKRKPCMEDCLTLLRDNLTQTHRGASIDTISFYLTFEGRENAYNPILDLLSNTPWDGRDRLPDLYAMLGIERSALSQTLLRKWLLQAIALLYNGTDGEPFMPEGCLILHGKQHYGKTRFFQRLAMRQEWFLAGAEIDERDRDTTRRIVTTWIAELDEIAGTFRHDLNHIKSFVLRDVDRYRLPYGRFDITAPRHTSICGTADTADFLVDTDATRRWWTIPLERKIEQSELVALDVVQLWSQVYHAVDPLSYAEKASCFRLTDDELESLYKRNKPLRRAEKAQAEVQDILTAAELDGLKSEPMTASEFKEQNPALRLYTSEQIGKALHACGVESKRTAKARLYILPTRR